MHSYSPREGAVALPSPVLCSPWSCNGLADVPHSRVCLGSANTTEEQTTYSRPWFWTWQGSKGSLASQWGELDPVPRMTEVGTQLTLLILWTWAAQVGPEMMMFTRAQAQGRMGHCQMSCMALELPVHPGLCYQSPCVLRHGAGSEWKSTSSEPPPCFPPPGISCQGPQTTGPTCGLMWSKQLPTWLLYQ